MVNGMEMEEPKSRENRQEEIIIISVRNDESPNWDNGSENEVKELRLYIDT